MMKFAGLLVGLVGAMALFVLAQDNNDAGTQSKIIALEKAWNQAYKLGDRKALDTLLDDQIVLINDDGSVQTKTQFLASVKATNSQEQQVAPESMSVHVFGNAAVATGVFRAKGVEGGKRYVVLDTWLFHGGKWVFGDNNAL